MSNTNIVMNMNIGYEEQQIDPDNLDIDTVYIVEQNGRRRKVRFAGKTEVGEYQLQPFEGMTIRFKRDEVDRMKFYVSPSQNLAGGKRRSRKTRRGRKNKRKTFRRKN